MTIQTVQTISADLPEQPYALQLIGPVPVVLAQASVHIRRGYIPSPDTPIDLFGATGSMSLLLVRGNPDPATVERADVATTEALELQHAQYQRDVQAAARQIIEDAAREQKQKQIAAQIADQEKALRKLKTELSNA